MTATASTRPRARRYPAKYAVRAREHVAAGWSKAATARLLGKEFGITPSPRIVGMWVDPKQAERNAAAGRRRWRRRHPTRPAPRAVRQMRALKEAGVPLTHIAKAMHVFHGAEITAGQVRYAIDNNVLPRPFRKGSGS